MENVNVLLYRGKPDLVKLVKKGIALTGNFGITLFTANHFHEFLLLAKERSITAAFISLPEDEPAGEIDKIIASHDQFPIVKIVENNNPQTGFDALKQGFQDFIFKDHIESYAFEKIIFHAAGLQKMLKQRMENEGRYRRMFENSNIGIYLSTIQGRLLEVNTAFAKMFGYNSPEDAISAIDNAGKNLYVNSDDRQRLIEAFKKQEVDHHQIELKLKRKDGSIFNGLLNMRPVKLQGRQQFLVEGFVQDISEKKALENQIKETLLFLREVLDNIPGPVFSKDLDLRYTGCNKEFERYIGFTEKEILGKRLLDLRNDKLARYAHAKDLELLATGQEQKFDHTIVFADGIAREAVFHKNIFRNRKGEISGIIGLILDTTEEKKTLQQLHEELSLNKALTELSKELLKPGTSISGISNRVISFAKEITHSTQGFAVTLSPQNDELSVHGFNDPGNEEFKISDNTSFFEKENGRYTHLWGYSLNTLKPFFTNKPQELSSIPGIPDGYANIKNFLSVPAVVNGKLVGQLALANSGEPYNEKDIDNVTKLSHLFSLAIQNQRSVDDLIAAKEKAEESDELKSAFLANMSHEIRTPLNAIVGFAQLLGDTNITDEETEEFKTTIINNTNILLRLINDIIEMAMIEAGELKIHLEKRTVRELVDNVFLIWTSRDEFLESSDRIHFLLEKPEEENDIQILIDPMRFNQIFDNLLMNAFRFTQKGQITLGYRYPGDSTVELYVKDTGVGIAPEFIKTIFERFRQADELKVRNFSGTGLGLAITKKFIEHLNGSIRVESLPGKGSCFYVSFPLPNEKTARAGSSVVMESIHGERSTEESKILSKSILIVEDSDANYEFLEVLLTKKGAKVQRAVDGKVAIEWALKRNFDLILMDLQLPRLSGFDAIKGIREINRDIPIIVQTAFSHSDERRKAFEAGCDAYLIKPLTSKKLLKTILNFC
jgi:two-component system, sensor histidine kinase